MEQLQELLNYYQDRLNIINKFLENEAKKGFPNGRCPFEFGKKNVLEDIVDNLNLQISLLKVSEK